MKRPLTPCQQPDADPELWHPTGAEDKRAREAMRAAKEACGFCWNAEKCLTDQLRIEGDDPVRARFGVFGGMGPAQRWRLSRGLPADPEPPRQQPAVKRVPLRHGNGPALAEHIELGEDPCLACTAYEVRMQKRMAERMESAVHGERSGFNLHRALGDGPCTPCKEWRRLNAR